MKNPSIPEKILLEEIRELVIPLQRSYNNISVGLYIRMIREQLKMSQVDLARRARVPRMTISRIERDKVNPSVQILRKILKALFCDLLIIPVPICSLEKIKEERARKLAESYSSYIRGTMSLEKQALDDRLIDEFVKKDITDILNSTTINMWKD